MKRNVMVTVGTLLLMTEAVSRAADDGAALYKSKCAGCHGAAGEGKGKFPAIKGTSMDASKLVDHITKGESTAKAPHKRESQV